MKSSAQHSKAQPAMSSIPNFTKRTLVTNSLALSIFSRFHCGKYRPKTQPLSNFDSILGFAVPEPRLAILKQSVSLYTCSFSSKAM